MKIFLHKNGDEEFYLEDHDRLNIIICRYINDVYIGYEMSDFNISDWNIKDGWNRELFLNYQRAAEIARKYKVLL